MQRVTSLVIVGSSAAGKTTLVDGLRGAAYRERVVIPRRLVTRPARNDDDEETNSSIDPPLFEMMVAAGGIHPHWVRSLESGRRVRYGFEAVPAREDRLRVYSANNDILRNRNTSVLAVLDTAAVIRVVARAETRGARLAVKSIGDVERQARLGDDGQDVLLDGVPVWEIDTTALAPRQGQEALHELVDRMFSANTESYPTSAAPGLAASGPDEVQRGSGRRTLDTAMGGDDALGVRPSYGAFGEVGQDPAQPRRSFPARAMASPRVP